MKSMKLSVVAALSFCLAACCNEIIESPESESEDDLTSKMGLHILGSNDTRSSISPDEDQIKNICVMAYDEKDGRLACAQTARSADEIEMELRAGTYNIYVTANMGEFDAPIKEQDICDAFHSIEDIAQLGQALPMCWKDRTVLRAGEKTTLYAKLSRLVSKVDFSVETGVLKGLEITSVRLCQAAGVIRPFMEGGSRILYADEAVDGDYASDEDISRLTAGESIFLYATENCQGLLLPDNTDPWTKVPESIGKKAELCTYIEMEGRWNESSDYEGKVVYRFYLGEDAASNFDIRRNSLHNLTLYLEEESLDRISWKIDASEMEGVSWEASSSLNDNFHEQDNFYVTENIMINFSFDENGQKYWKKRDNAFSLEGIDSNGNTVIHFDTPVNLGKGKYQATGTCISEGRYDILIINSKTGKKEYVLDDGTVHTPGIIAGEEGLYADKPVKGFDRKSRIEINGDSMDICLYLVDDEGYNLNQGHYYGCDFSICRWNMNILNTAYGFTLNENATIEEIPGNSCSDSYAVCYRLSLDNDGEDKQWNRLLTESLGRDIIQLNFTEASTEIETDHMMDIETRNMEIAFMAVPDKFKATLGTEFMYVIDNPSNIPLAIKGLKLNSMNKEPDPQRASAILCRDIKGHIGTDPLLISLMPESVCSLEEGSSPSVIIDGKRCYPAYDDDVEQNAIPSQKAMFHTFDVNYLYSDDAWMGGISGELNLYDTPAHMALYGKDGYGNCGALMYTNNYSIDLFDTYNGTTTDFSDYGDLLNQDYIDEFNDIIKVELGINEKNELTARASETVTVDISISGTLTGHIRCVSVQDPFNTIWGHYFTHEQEFSTSQTIVIDTDPRSIDNGTISDAFAQLRTHKYYSVQDAWNVDEFRNPKMMEGTFREYLKPESMQIVVRMESMNGCPIAISFSGSLSYDYKTSDPVSWPTGSGYRQIVPSSYSGFDSGLDDDGCPPGSRFKAETVNFQPKVLFYKNQGLYHK